MNFSSEKIQQAGFKRNDQHVDGMTVKGINGLRQQLRGKIDQVSVEQEYQICFGVFD